MYVSLEKVVNLSELDPIVIDGKRYWTGALYIVKQNPDYGQMVKIIKDGNRFHFVWNGYTFSGCFVWEMD
jgi:hypothetical protein